MSYVYAHCAMRSHCHCILSRIICCCKLVFRLFILISFASGENVPVVSVQFCDQFFFSFSFRLVRFCLHCALAVAINLFVLLTSPFSFALVPILFFWSLPRLFFSSTEMKFCGFLCLIWLKIVRSVYDVANFCPSLMSIRSSSSVWDRTRFVRSALLFIEHILFPLVKQYIRRNETSKTKQTHVSINEWFMWLSCVHFPLGFSCSQKIYQ